MQKYLIIISLLALISCNNGETKTEDKATNEASYEEALNKMSNNFHEVKVLEATISGSYTYALLEEDGKEYWAAIDARELNEGATYYYKDGMEMKNFESKSLGKVFESIWFINDLRDSKPELKQTNAEDHKKAADVHESIKVEKAEGGYSLSDVFSMKSELENQVIIIKGQVVKINPNIMNTNWIHIQDGTEYNGLFDLTITSSEAINFELGDVVTFKGTLVLNKDFGHGYQYDYLLEDAIQQ